jgi:hypothetical protein
MQQATAPEAARDASDRRRSRMFTVKRVHVLGQPLGHDASGAQMSQHFSSLDCQMAERQGFENSGYA